MKEKDMLDGKCLRISKVMSIGAILILGLMFNVQLLAGIVDTPSEKVLYDGALGRNFFGLQDGVSDSQEFYGYTPVPEYNALEIHTSDRAEFWYMGVSPYYKVYLKGNTVRMDIHNAWIEYELGQEKTVVQTPEGSQLNIETPKMPEIADCVLNQNELSVFNVFESVDVSYKVDTSLLTEALVFKEPKQVTRIIQKIEWGGITPEYQDDGSIVFVDENGDKIVKLLPPFMEDAVHNVCDDVHYEIIETESGYELHKIIDEKGLEWLKNAVYPVVLDPSMQTFEDAWESSGLTPYGQYFKNLKEYVNPANGLLTVTQTDLTIPGRGLDLTLSRVYQTPAVFYWSYPYDYEAPPVDVGNGWQLNLPYVGDKYLHLWGGTVYKIEWSGSTFTNHEGSHFTLVKNGDSTYTLTMASGTVYEFSTSGYLTQMKDLDQNTISFTYTSGDLTSITDTIGRTVSLSYSNDRLWKITYNGYEIEFSYDENGCLQWMEDFLNRRTSYYYNSGYNNWLLSKIEYPTTGYTTYQYNRFSDSGYYKYYVTNQKVYETNQVRHTACSYTGSFSEITSSEATIKNESDTVKGFYSFNINSDGLITQKIIKNASGTPIRKLTYTYSSRKEVTQQSVYNDGSTLSYTNYYAYDSWGNIIYAKNAESHEQFFSYANTDTSGFFADNTGAIIKKFTNAFSNCTVPSSVHTAILGVAEKQDNTYVKEVYVTYDSESHPTQMKTSFGETTTWLTYSGTFNEYTDDTSFSVDLTGHTVTGNGALKVTGTESDPTYSETHSSDCPLNPNLCPYSTVQSSSWDPYSQDYCEVYWVNHHVPTSGTSTNGPFTHYPATLGYQSYTPSAYSVTTYWKAYPVTVKYNLDGAAWKTVSTNLKDTTAKITVPISGGSHTLNFSESSSKQTKFSWWLYVPVDNTPDSYTTSMQYDTYGNITSMTDAESNTVNFTYGSGYSYAYLTEISATTGTETITAKASYDYYRGWITSIQEPKGVASSGYDTLFTYDVLGRVTKKEFPLLSGQSQRSYVEAVYDDVNRTVTIIDQLQHYRMHEYDKLGRLTAAKIYTGEYGSGTLYATISYTYYYDDKIKTVTDPGNDTYTYSYDFLGRKTQIQYPDSSVVTYSYDDTNYKMTFTNGRGYDRIYWFDWLSRLTKVEEEYATSIYAQTVYQYDEVSHVTSFTDAETHATTFEYASLFGLTKTVYPDSQYEHITYDNVGNVATFTDPEGYKTTYTYDDIYRLTEAEYGKISNEWQYYKQISITNFSSDYQYKITVHKGSGTDDTHNVYLNNHCQNDFDDIRFRGSDKETDLDHYRESYTEGDSAVFWVELPPTDQTIYIYYGNASAASASNGENTFIFFDDCESGAATDTWTENDASYGDIEYTTSESKYGLKSMKCTQISSNSNYNISKAISQSNFILEFYMKQGASDNRSFLRLNEDTSPKLTVRWKETGDMEYYTDSPAQYNDTGYDYSTAWVLHRFTCTSSDDVMKWGADDTTIAADAHRASWSTIDTLNIFIGAHNYVNDSVYYDNIYIRKYEQTEPTFSFGSETGTGGGYQELATVSFSYDLNGNRIKMEDDAPNTGDYIEYSYDCWNRLTNTTRYIGQNSYSVSYEYDTANKLTTLTYPDTMQILYAYDDLNRTTEVKRYIDGSNDEILLDNVQYNTESLLTQFDYGNDLTATFSYDSRDRLTALDVKDGGTSYLDLDYAYDNNSNITQLVNGWRDTNSNWHSDTESYSYDGLDRLTSANCTSWSHTYSYDKVGNRTSKDGITYTINSVNEVTALSDGTSFAYDDNGNRTQKTKGADTWDYTYDYANRLKKVEENSSVIGEYVYDGDGTRIQVTEDSVTTIYIYSGLDILYEETMTGTAVYIYGPTGRIAKRTTINQETNIFYYNTDHLGSIRLVTDSSKNIVSAITYHPFGGINIKEGSEDYLFTGKEKDSTGFYYYGARYYDSELGRFLTRDLSGGRIQTPKTLNRFTYCLNNPLKYIDPDGRECVKSYPTSLERRVLLSRFIPSVGYVTVKYNYGGGFAYILIMCVELSRAVAGMVPFGKENYDKFLEKVGYDYFYAQTIYGGYLEPSKALEEFLYFEGIEEVDIEELIRIKLSEDAFWVYIREGDNEYRLLIIKDENGVWNIFQGYEFKDPDKGSNNFTEEGNIACDPSRGIYPE